VATVPQASNEGSSSTTWAWKKVKIRRPAEGHTKQPAAGRRWRTRSRRDPSEKLGVIVWWRGGAEDWWMVRARGEDNAYPGHTCISDLFHDINRSH
jgi:hypothetical protein